MIEQQGLRPQNSGATTADWIGRAEGGAIYAYDLGALPTGGTERADFTREDSGHTLQRVSRRQPTSSEPDRPSSGA